MTRARILCLIIAAVIGLLPAMPLAALRAFDTYEPPPGVEIQEKLGLGLPSGVVFVSDKKEKVTVDDLMALNKTMIITPVYYTCPNLCNLVLNGLMNAIVREKGLKLGRDYVIVSFSINPEETPDVAAAKKANYIKKIVEQRSDLKAEELDAAWYFLTGPQDSIASLASALGFYYIKEGNDFLHRAAIMMVSKEGVISRYLYGIEFNPNDFKLGLLETSRGEIGSVTDQLVMFCFSYDPVKKKYSLVAWRVMRIASVFGAVLTLGLLGFFWYRESKKSKTKKNQEIKP